MNRRKFDFLLSIGGLVLAAILLVGGFVLQSNANFARGYVADQLGAQKITFKAADKLSAEESEQQCLIEYAGQDLTTGKQAECFANHYIGLHMEKIAGGKTYSELGTVQSGLKAKVQKDPSDKVAAAELEKVTAQRDSLFKGDALRSMLLTSYGFSELGEKAGQGAVVAFSLSGVLVLLSGAGLVHAATTRKDKKVLA